MITHSSKYYKLRNIHSIKGTAWIVDEGENCFFGYMFIVLLVAVTLKLHVNMISS